MPYIAVEIDAANEAPHVARAAGISEDAALAGLVRLWLRCFREKTDQITTMQLAGVFGGDGSRIASVLEEFGFLEASEAAWRVRGADRYLRLNEARRKGGLAAKKHLVPGAAHRSNPSAAAEEQPRLQPNAPLGSASALPPSTEHRIKKEVLREEPAHTPSQVPTHPTHCVTEQAVKRPELHLAAVEGRKDRKPSVQEQLAKRLEEQRMHLLDGPVPDLYPVKRLNPMLAPLLGFDGEVLLDAHALFCRDPYAQSRDPPCPLPLFVAQVSQWISKATRLEAVP